MPITNVELGTRAFQDAFALARATTPAVRSSYLPTITILTTVAVGATIQGDHGEYTQSPLSYTFRWLRDGLAISGATSKTYALQSADFGHLLTFEETPTSAIGAGAPATSGGLMLVTLPAAPTIALTAGNGQVSIAWTDGATGGSAITGHKLYRGTGAGGESLVGTITSASPYVDMGLANGAAYYYKLSAVNAAGEGALSAEQSATPASGGGVTLPASAMLVRVKADASSTITQAAGTVSSWADFNATGYDLTQGSTSVQPAFVADSGDGQPCVVFSGSGIQLRNTVQPSQAEDSFIAVIWQNAYVAGSGNNAIVSRGGGGALLNSAATMQWNAAGSTDGQLGLNGAPAIAQGKWIILSGRRSAAVNFYPGGTGNLGQMELRENGAIIRRVTHTGGAVASVFALGNNPSGVKVKEMIWGNRYWTDAELLSIENELNAKYNVYANVALRRSIGDGAQRWMTANNAAAPSAYKLGILLFGQSNALGEAYQPNLNLMPTVFQTPLANGYIWNGLTSAWELLQVGTNNVSDNYPAAPAIKHGMEPALLYDLAADKGVGYLVKSGVGGTALYDRWAPTLTKTANLWRTAMDQFELARMTLGLATGIELTPSWLIWYQGEADAILSSAAISAYGSNEQVMFASTRAFINGGSAMKIISVRVKADPSDANYDAVSAAKVANASIIPNYQVIPGWTVASSVGSPHGDTPSMLTIGNVVAGIMGCTTTAPIGVHG
jgi:hypothetical protein